MDIIELIKKKYGESCQLRGPLDEEGIARASELLPTQLCEILQQSNGISEMMSLPNVHNGEPFVSGSIIYPFEDIISETAHFHELFNESGTVFAGNGAGGYYVLKLDGKVYLYEYAGEEGELAAEDLRGYFGGE